jgi:hypothetical protein
VRRQDIYQVLVDDGPDLLPTSIARMSVPRPKRQEYERTHGTGELVPWKNRANFTTPNQDAKPQKTGNISELGHAPNSD